MPWHTSDRKSRLPKDWAARRLVVMNRDGWSCQWRYPNGGRCGAPANQCDHIDRKGGDDYKNLRALCEKHHSWKSSSEGGQARAGVMAQLKKKFARPAERQPGEIPNPSGPLERKGY